jgi:peptide/nickel transport system substrate-binding protein
LKRHYYAPLALVVVLIAISLSYIPVAYGHGIGADQTLPQYISNRQVSVSASLKPDFIDSSEQPRLVIRTFDTGNNATITGIDYQIAVQLHNETLLDQRFKPSDGIVFLNLQPDKNIEGWQIIGRQSVSPNEQVQLSQSNPVTIKNRIFTDGGLYHIIVTLEKSSTGLSIDSDRKFDLYVTVGKTFTFDNIETAEGKVTMSARTYYDQIENFAYDYANKTLSFSMPFNWEQTYVSQVPVLHIEVHFPKSIKELQSNSYRGTINGNDLDPRAILIDDYSLEDSRTMHFVLTKDMLSSLAKNIKGDVATFTLSPIEKPKFPIDIPSNDNKYIFEVAWGPDIIETGTPTTFAMNLQDSAGGLLENSAFDFVVTQNGKEMYRQHLTSGIGDYVLQHTFTNPGTVTLTAANINGGGQGASASINLIVQQGSNNATSQTPQQQQPSGCLIATAAFGSELTPQVQFLRDFRDTKILSTTAGSSFMNVFNAWYYSFSPYIADFERQQLWLQQTVRIALYPLLGMLTVTEKAYDIIPGEFGSLSAGLTASSMIGAAYFWPFAIISLGRVRLEKIDLRFLVAILGFVSAAVICCILIGSEIALMVTTSLFVLTILATSAVLSARTIVKVARTFNFYSSIKSILFKK